MSTTVATPVRSYGWLRNAPFDMLFIVGVAGVAVLSGLLVWAKPEWFNAILFFDLFVLGYPHVIATFTRMVFDSQSFREYRFYSLGLPWLVLAGTVVLGKIFGLWALTTLYLYWQWFHYTRQSYGIVRIFSRKADGMDVGGTQLLRATLYLFPLWGILYRSHVGQETFLGFQVKYVPTPEILVHISGILALATMAWWLFRMFRAQQAGRMPVALTLYMLSHFVVFFFGYIAIPDITHGWLVINIWHNAQYLLIVWMYNNNRFRTGVDGRHRFLSTISQSKPLHIAAFIGVVLVVSTVVYAVIALVLRQPTLAAIPLISLITYQTINFHHYVVDGRIWKVRKKQMQERMGIPSS